MLRCIKQSNATFELLVALKYFVFQNLITVHTYISHYASGCKALLNAFERNLHISTQFVYLQQENYVYICPSLTVNSCLPALLAFLTEISQFLYPQVTKVAQCEHLSIFEHAYFSHKCGGTNAEIHNIKECPLNLRIIAVRGGGGC